MEPEKLKYFLPVLGIIAILTVVLVSTDWDFVLNDPGIIMVIILLGYMFFGVMIGIIYFGMGYSWFQADPGQQGQTMVKGTRYTFSGDTKAPFYKYRFQYIATFLTGFIVLIIITAIVGLG